jgi:hypothetical protein
MTKLHDKPWICLSHNEGIPSVPGLNSGNRGYAFLILMMMVTILLISLTAALPSIYQEGQREKEEELIFRGSEYARAIYFFHNKFGRYPSKVDELVKKTNGIRFLRQAYADPMTADGKWRFIHANAAGMVNDSKLMTMPIPKPGDKGGLNPAGQIGSALGQSGRGIGGGINPPSQQDTTGQQSSQDSDSMKSESTSGSSTSSSGQMLGAFIVGVASTSKKQSIRVYDNQTEYDKWEFLAVGQGVANLLAPGLNMGGQISPTGQPGSPQTPGQNPRTGPGGFQLAPGTPPQPTQPQFP